MGSPQDAGAGAADAADGVTSCVPCLGIPVPEPEAPCESRFSTIEDEGASADIEKWRRMVRQGIRSFNQKHPHKFQRRVCRGIPAQHRWVVWKAAVGFQDKVEPGRYRQLCSIESTWKQLINVDTARTFPEISTFDGDYQNSMRQILCAYSNFNSEVGYCQGMNFVVGLLLLVSSRQEEEVFWMFTCLMEDWSLRGFYMETFPLLHAYLRAAKEMLDDAIPDLGAHFTHENLQPSDYLQQWFLTLFINSLPLPTVLIIWDGLMCNGLHVLLSTALALQQTVKHILLSMNFEDIMYFFKVMKVCKEDDEAKKIGHLLMKRTCWIHVPQHILNQLNM